MRRRALLLATLLGLAVSGAARADALDSLKAFVADVKTGRAAFTQVVTSADGAKQRRSTGSFEFSRPNRFRFAYAKPYEQLIVSDGQKVWLYDPELNQVTVRAFGSAIGATPAALLAGTALERDFELKALPDREGLQWAQAAPRAKDGSFQSLQIGFRGGALAARIRASRGQPRAAAGALPLRSAGRRRRAGAVRRGPRRPRAPGGRPGAGRIPPCPR